MPRWTHEVRLSDLWRNDALTFEQRRDAIVQRFLDSQWVKYADPGTRLDIKGLLDDLSAACDASDFDDTWEAIYDLADEQRVWIDIWTPVGAA